MLANCRDIWERDYAHLALQKKVEKRDALEEWLHRRKEEDTYRRIPQVCAPLPASGRPLGSTAHDQRRRRGQHTIFRKRCTVAGHKQLCKGHLCSTFHSPWPMLQWLELRRGRPLRPVARLVGRVPQDLILIHYQHSTN